MYLKHPIMLETPPLQREVGQEFIHGVVKAHVQSLYMVDGSCCHKERHNQLLGLREQVGLKAFDWPRCPLISIDALFV